MFYSILPALLHFVKSLRDLFRLEQRIQRRSQLGVFLPRSALDPQRGDVIAQRAPDRPTALTRRQGGQPV